MKVLVTGSAGFIGSRLAASLSSQGHTVRGVDRKNKKTEGLAEFVWGDLVEEDVRERALAGVDCVFHLAAAKDDWGISDEEFFRDNVEVTRALIETARRHDVRDWIFYSSVAAIGPRERAADESAELTPVDAYGTSKAKAEQLFHELAVEQPTRAVIIRPSVVYGPGNFSYTNVYRLIDAIYKNRFVMVGQGEAVKTTSYIENLIAATHFLADRLREGVHTFVYVDEPALRTAELVERIRHLLGKRIPLLRLPRGVASTVASVADVAASATGINFPITADRIEKFCTSTNYDASAIRELGFQQPVSNDKALRRTIAWHIEQA